MLDEVKLEVAAPSQRQTYVEPFLVLTIDHLVLGLLFLQEWQ